MQAGAGGGSIANAVLEVGMPTSSTVTPRKEEARAGLREGGVRNQIALFDGRVEGVCGLK